MVSTVDVRSCDGNGRFFGIFDPGAGWPIEDQIGPDAYDQLEDLCRVGIEFSIFVVWPTAGVAESVAAFDADEIIAKSGDAIPLLPEP